MEEGENEVELSTIFVFSVLRAVPYHVPSIGMTSKWERTAQEEAKSLKPGGGMGVPSHSHFS